MAGVTALGFVPLTSDDIKADLEAALKASFGESIDLTPQSNFGQFVGIMAERLADLWLTGQDVYAAMDPDSSTGTALDALAGLTGTIRKPATHSTVSLTATGTPGTVLLAGRVASVVTAGTRFVTLADATIGAGGTVDIVAQAEDTGPKVGNAGTVTVIETPVSGWTSVTNALDADLGSDVETDSALRIRREQELRLGGKSALEAIRTDVLETLGVTSCTVFQNVSDTTDGNGIPPHAVRCLVLGGADADVASSIFGSVAAGIATDGTTTVSVTDSQGVAQSIKFSRPSLVNIYVSLTLTYDASAYPADGDAQVKAAIVAFGDAQKTGKDVTSTGVLAQAFKVAGVLDVSAAYIGTAPSPASAATISVSAFQLATFDTSRITITSSSATP
jgi:uncharacterized phage protein gp47/JayE